MPRILIVDDEPAIVRGLEDNLRFEGYETLAATSGEEGLSRALGEAPDLVLLDIMMPKLSGLGRVPRAPPPRRGRAGDHAHRAGRRGRPRARSRAGRR